MPNKTCCFTGHRPSALPWRYEESGLRFSTFRTKLKKVIEQAITDGYTNFISGMAEGIDIIAAELIVELRKKYPYITLECAIPCINQTEKWSDFSIQRYNNIKNEADKVTIVSNTLYYNGCMSKRNKYMVDNSSGIIAVFNGKQGGTAQTISMARRQGLKIITIKP